MAEAQITKAAALAASQQQQQQQQQRSLQTQQKKHHHHPQPLVPIRVDVTSSKQNFRIIDTLLFDPQVWPVPLVFERCDDNNSNDDDDMDDVDLNHNKNNSSTPTRWRVTDDSIEANVRFLAHNILTDAEVQGMGRTTRHLTGRADLWSTLLQETIMDQIRPQIQTIFEQTNAAEALTMTSTRKNKRQRQAAAAQPAATKKIKPTPPPLPNEETIPDQQQQQSGSEMTLPPTPPLPQPSSCYVPTPLEQARFQYLAQTIKESSTSSSSSSSSACSLIPIRIRMSVHGIRIHDDFLWDVNLHSTTTSTAMNALELARITGKDLNLPNEAIQAMAIDIVEQIHGLIMCRDSSSDNSKNNNNDNNLYKQELLEIIASEKKQQEQQQQMSNTTTSGTTTSVGHHHKHNVTAAWLLDSRKHAMDAAHLVSQHRPGVTQPPPNNST